MTQPQCMLTSSAAPHGSVPSEGCDLAWCSEEGHGLLLTFFGKDGKQQLDLKHFSEFCRALHAELVRLEYRHYDYADKV